MRRERPSDTISFKLDLTPLPESTRRKIPFPWHERRDAKGRHGYETPFSIDAHYPGAQTQIYVGCDGNGDQHTALPSYLTAQIHVPNATCGHNLVHGTSAYAAAIAALHVVLSGLARKGVPPSELKALTLENMTLTGVTLTYLFPFKTPREAHQSMDHLYRAGRTLVKNATGYESTNKTITLKQAGQEVTAYVKTDHSHCRKEALTPSVLELGSRILRVEAKLSHAFLQEKKLEKVAAWQEGYRDDLYRILFDEIVGKMFRLETPLRSRRPKPQAIEKFPPTQADLLNRYFAGEDLQEATSVLASRNPKRYLADYAGKFKEALNLDISIPWTSHRELQHGILAKWLVYPGDMNLDVEIASICFVKNSWDDLRMQLEERLVD